MIAAAVLLHITLVSPTGQHEPILPQEYPTMAKCVVAKKKVIKLMKRDSHGYSIFLLKCLPKGGPT